MWLARRNAHLLQETTKGPEALGEKKGRERLSSAGSCMSLAWSPHDVERRRGTKREGEGERGTQWIEIKKETSKHEALARGRKGKGEREREKERKRGVTNMEQREEPHWIQCS